MNRIFPWILGSFILLISTGCESMGYSEYTGPARSWPTGSSFSEASHDVPVYRGWPERPYEVLGVIQFNNPNVDWNQGDMKQAARQARQLGGDAIIMVPKGSDPSPTISALRSDLSISERQTVAVVVRWK